MNYATVLSLFLKHILRTIIMFRLASLNNIYQGIKTRIIIICWILYRLFYCLASKNNEITTYSLLLNINPFTTEKFCFFLRISEIENTFS